MRQRCMLFVLMLVILFGMSAMTTANAIPFSVDDMDISIAPGYSIYKGIWIARSPKNAFLLLGNPDENVMKVAIASQSSDGQYQIIALSEKIISYEEYCSGAVQLLDKWDDGHPYFWYESRQSRDVYIAVTEVAGDWKVVYGYITYWAEDLKYVFYTTENPNELVVYETYYPQIYWPTQESMSLDHYDITIIENTCAEALRYLEDFQSSHHFGDQDEKYKIVWLE